MKTGPQGSGGDGYTKFRERRRKRRAAEQGRSRDRRQPHRPENETFWFLRLHRQLHPADEAIHGGAGGVSGWRRDGDTRGEPGGVSLPDAGLGAIDTWNRWRAREGGKGARWGVENEIQACAVLWHAGCAGGARCRDAEDACGLASGGIPGAHQPPPFRAPGPTSTNQLLKRRHGDPPAQRRGGLNSAEKAVALPSLLCDNVSVPADASRESVHLDLFHRARHPSPHMPLEEGGCNGPKKNQGIRFK